MVVLLLETYTHTCKISKPLMPPVCSWMKDVQTTLLIRSRFGLSDSAWPQTGLSYIWLHGWFQLTYHGSLTTWKNWHTMWPHNLNWSKQSQCLKQKVLHLHGDKNIVLYSLGKLYEAFIFKDESIK